MNNFSREHFFSWGILLALFLYMWALNFMMPLHRDDYLYAMIWNTAEKITSFPDIFRSLYIHYFEHGGRMVSYFVQESFFLAGKEWFNPFNALLFTLLIMIIYWHAKREFTLRFNPYIILLLIFFCWFGFPHFALVTIWMNGSCVYLLTAVLIFAFLLPYNFSLAKSPPFKDNFFSVPGMFLAGIPAGWTVENTAATMCLIIACTIFYAYKKGFFQKWMAAGFLGAVLGLFLLVRAPGNFVRYTESKYTILSHFNGVIAGSAEMLIYVLPLILFLVLSLRIVLKSYAEENINLPKRQSVPISSLILGASSLFLLVSYLNDSFFSQALGNFIYDNAVVPLGAHSAKLKRQLFNTLSGIEEFGAYLLLVTLAFKHTSQKFKLRKSDMVKLMIPVRLRDIISANSAGGGALLYGAAVIAIAVLNNLVMIASPYFPARAGFGTVVFLIIGAVSLLKIPQLYSFWVTEQKKYVASIILIALLPMMFAVFYQYSIVFKEDAARVKYVENQVKLGNTLVEVDPISIKTRFLRHVYFVDIDNGVTKGGFIIYYQLKDVKLKN